MGHWLMKPWKKSKRGPDLWGSAPTANDQLFKWEWIMANKRSNRMQMVMQALRWGTLVPKNVGETLRDFTQWALPYLFLEGEGGLGDLAGLVNENGHQAAGGQNGATSCL